MIRIGIVGTGPIAYIMSEAIKENRDTQVFAVYSRTYEKGKEFAERAGIERIYTDYEEMLNDPDVDLVYIASPNSLHYRQGIEAIRHKKNVIIEKPFSSNYNQTKKLIDLAEQKGVFLFEGMTIYQEPNYKLLKEKISQIGRVKEVQCCYMQYSHKYDDLLAGKEPNVFSLKYSGGALMDLGIYNIHFILGLFGEPRKIDYVCRKHENGIDLGGTLIRRYDDMNAVALAAKDVGGDNRNIIAGENGYIIVDGGSNGHKPFTVCIGDQSERYDIVNNHSFLFSELKAFADICISNNEAAMKGLWIYTESAMKVIDRAKESANIVFAEDCDS